MTSLKHLVLERGGFKAEVITSGTMPPGGLHKTKAVLPCLQLGLYREIIVSGIALAVLTFFRSLCRVSLSCGDLFLVGSFLLRTGGRLYSSLMA